MEVLMPGAKERKPPHPDSRESGFALVMMIMLLAMLVIVGMGLAMETGIRDRMAFNLAQGVETLYIAEAGVADAAWQLAQNPAWRTGFTDKAFGSGAYDVTLQDITAGFLQNTVRVSAVGMIGDDLEREVDAHVYVYPKALNHALYCMEAGELVKEGGHSVTIIGTELCSDTTPKVVVDWAAYKTIAQGQGRYVDGDLNVDWNWSDSGGTWYIEGNLNFKNGGAGTMTGGTFVVENDLMIDVEDGESITVNAGGNGAAFLAGQNVDFKNGRINIQGMVYCGLNLKIETEQGFTLAGNISSAEKLVIDSNAVGTIRWDPYLIPRHPALVGQASAPYDLAMAEGGWRQVLE